MQRISRAAAHLALCVGLCLVLGRVWAGEQPCLVPMGVPSTQLERRIALHALDLQARQCTHDADWHAQRGALLLALGRAAEAAEALERAILLAPNHAGARVDYADALALLGDVDSARALAEALLSQADVPVAARQHLLAGLQRWQLSQSAWQFAAMLGAGLMWESNLNGGPADSNLLLTLPEGVLNVQLVPEAQPQSGFARLYHVGASASRPLAAERQLLLRTQLRWRDAAAAGNDYQTAQFDATLVQPGAHGELAAQLSHGEQHFAGARLLGETRLLAQYQWRISPCAPVLGADAAWRRFPSAAILDGEQLALRLGAHCSRAPWRTDAQLRLALDRPLDPDRPGGRQRWAELRLGAGWQGERYAARLEFNLDHVADHQGYSPLLGAGRVRKVFRQALRAELVRVLDPHWELGASIDYFRQRASLALFEVDNVGLYFGARYRY